jgi:hypothetical protein
VTALTRRAVLRPRCTGGWAELPGELLAKVLEMLQAVEHQEGALTSQLLSPRYQHTHGYMPADAGSYASASSGP